MQPLSITALFQYSVDTRGIDLTSFIFNCVGSNHQIFESNICKLFANAERIEDEIQDVSFFLFTAEKVHINPSYIAAIGVYIIFFKQNTNLSYFVYVIETLQGDSLSGDLHLNENGATGYDHLRESPRENFITFCPISASLQYFHRMFSTHQLRELGTYKGYKENLWKTIRCFCLGQYY